MAVLDRHVQVAAHQHGLAAHIHVVEGLEGAHRLGSLVWGSGSPAPNHSGGRDATGPVDRDRGVETDDFACYRGFERLMREFPMATGVDISGLIKWAQRDEWEGMWKDVFWDHIEAGCEAHDLEPDELSRIIGEQHFMNLWGCAFEDFLNRSRASDGQTAVADYLKRRGWKEPVPVKRYMQALGASVMSLYEVSDIVPGESFLARDLIRGGEPVRVSERSASRMLQPWDRLGARVVEYNGKTVIGGGVLPFDAAGADRLQEALGRGLKRMRKEIRKIAKGAGESLPEAGEREAAALIVLMNSAPVFSGVWLTHWLPRILGLERPKLVNHDGDEIVFCKTRYPWVRGTTAEAIRDRLRQVPDFFEASETFWNWIREAPAEDAGDAQTAEETDAETLSTMLDSGELVLGNVEIVDGAVVLTTNSRPRSERGIAILTACLGDLVRPPLTEIQTADQAMAESASESPAPSGLSPEDKARIVRDTLDAHYRETLDLPIKMLGGVSPRAAVRTAKGKEKVVAWLKYLENQGHRNPDETMASYDFTWMWQELRVLDRRR
ncbi:hypothetical protein [Inquilinus sp. CA228]|uniref:hypothetical protein n=1 Tax=Inquilinus sp. CA228 TaxID=3455609 RepID=UPI003F8D26A1